MSSSIQVSKTDSDLSPAPASPLLQGHWTLLHPNRQIARPLPDHKDEVKGDVDDDDDDDDDDDGDCAYY